MRFSRKKPWVTKVDTLNGGFEIWVALLLLEFFMSRRLNVLVAEDDGNDRMLMKRAFSMANVAATFLFVVDGDETVAYLRGADQFSDRTRFPFPDLLLLDIQMPKRDGFEVLEWARGEGGCKTLPVIVFSSSHRNEDVHRALSLGANSYLEKTVSSSGYVAMARSLNSYWVRHNKFPGCQSPDQPC
jgi:two-component system response regulator